MKTSIGFDAFASLKNKFAGLPAPSQEPAGKKETFTPKCCLGRDEFKPSKPDAQLDPAWWSGKPDAAKPPEKLEGPKPYDKIEKLEYPGVAHK